jgi:hypothetical protein
MIEQAECVEMAQGALRMVESDLHWSIVIEILLST